MARLHLALVALHRTGRRRFNGENVLWFTLDDLHEPLRRATLLITVGVLGYWLVSSGA